MHCKATSETLLPQGKRIKMEAFRFVNLTDYMIADYMI